MFGFANTGWKEWRTFDGTPVLVPGGFRTECEANGDLLLYPEGDESAPASGRMPRGGFYFDAIVRQPPIDESRLRVEDNLEEFQPISDADIAHFERESKRLYAETDKAILASFGGTSFGDVAFIPAPWLKRPKGIRDVEEWYISTAARKGHVFRIFEAQCGTAIRNLSRLAGAVGERATAVLVTGTDFGMQTGTMISAETYRELFGPFHKAVNDWIHRHTTWKTFIHSCGSVAALIEDFIEAGFDILNPVQCAATGMEAGELKRRFGDRITFWGGGADTQRTLPFGTPSEVAEEVRERIRVFGKGGGFVFNTIHNVQPLTPIENVLAMLRAVDEGR
ncbi:MAG: uroporphyrinogen decarboxylase family protein [Planctomycetota bacterium]